MTRTTPAFLPALLATALALLPPAAHALDPIDTDGPDFVESSEVVPQGHFQYEVDFTSTRNRAGREPEPGFSTPTLLKYGFARDWELRIAPEGYDRLDGRHGAGDTALGVKWHVQDRDEATGAPSVAWIFHVDTPSGARDFRGTGYRPSLRAVVTWDLPDDFALGLMPGLKYDTRSSDGQRFTAGILGLVLNRRLSEADRVFAEVSAPQIAPMRDGGTQVYASLGAAHMIGNDAQVGIRAGVGANHNTPHRQVLVEIAQRF